MASEERTKIGRALSAPVVSLTLGLALSALGALPVDCVSYDAIWHFLMPLAAAMFLLDSDLSSLLQTGGTTLVAFLIGAVGMVLGAIVSFKLLSSYMGHEGSKLAACLCASYVGGAVNFAAVAKAVCLSPSLVPVAVAVDNAAMAVYLAALMAVPVGRDASNGPVSTANVQKHSVTCESVAVTLAAAALSCTLGQRLAAQLGIPSLTLVITAVLASGLAVLAGKSGNSSIFAGASQMGGAIMMMFFAMVGAAAGSLHTVLGQASSLLPFLGIMCAVHAATLLVLGRMLNLPLRVLIIASNANAGGPATAAGMAASKGWHDLLQPAMMTGSLGYALGTGAGLLVARLLGAA